MADKEFSIKKNYILFQIFFPLLVWVPIFYEFQKHHGLTDTQIFSIQSYYYLFFMFLEIPTGFLSDQLGHRLALILGSASLIVANILPVFFVSYSAFMFHFFLIALSRSLISGSASALLYDSLDKNKSAYKEIEGQARSFGLIAKIISWSLIGFIMKYQYNSPYLLTTVSSVFAFYFALKFPLATHKNEASKFSLKLLKDEMTDSKGIVPAIVLGISLFILIRVCQVNLFQPLLKDHDFSIASFGVIMATMTIFESIGSMVSYKIQRFYDDTIVFSSTIVVCLSYFLITHNNQVVTVIGFFLFSFFAGISFPVQKKLLNDQIKNQNVRATIISFESIIDRLSCALLLFIIGTPVEDGYINEVMIFVAIICLLFVCLTYFFLRKKRLN